MRLRAQITIDIETPDFNGAAEHQRRLEVLFEDVRRAYAQAELEFRQRRIRTPAPPTPGQTRKHYTGRMHDYD